MFYHTPGHYGALNAAADSACPMGDVGGRFGGRTMCAPTRAHGVGGDLSARPGGRALRTRWVQNRYVAAFARGFPSRGSWLAAGETDEVVFKFSSTFGED